MERLGQSRAREQVPGRPVEDLPVRVPPLAPGEVLSRIAQFATLASTERGDRPRVGRGRTRARKPAGSRRCSTRSPQRTTSKEAGSSGSSIDSTSPTRTSSQKVCAAATTSGSSSTPDDYAASLDQGSSEIAARAADVEDAPVPTDERQEARVATQRPGVELDVAGTLRLGHARNSGVRRCLAAAAWSAARGRTRRRRSGDQGRGP